MIMFFSFDTFGQLQTKRESRIYTNAEQELTEKMRYASNNEVVAYIQEVLSMEVPATHQLPKHYKNFNSYAEASEAMAKERFPNFYMKTGDELIQEIKSAPVEYKFMIFDYKRLRELYQHTLEKK